MAILCALVNRARLGDPNYRLIGQVIGTIQWRLLDGNLERSNGLKQPRLTMWTNFFKNFSAPRLTCGFSRCGHLIGQVSGSRATRARSSPFSRKASRLDKCLAPVPMFSTYHPARPARTGRGAMAPNLNLENSTVATDSGTDPHCVPRFDPRKGIALSLPILAGARDSQSRTVRRSPVSVLVSNGQVIGRKRINATVKDAIPKGKGPRPASGTQSLVTGNPGTEPKELGMSACFLRTKHVSRIHYGGANGSPRSAHCEAMSGERKPEAVSGHAIEYVECESCFVGGLNARPHCRDYIR